MEKTKKTKIKLQFESIMKGSTCSIELSRIHKLTNKKIPGVAFSTIYRIARAYEKKGLIARVDWRERGSKYEWVDKHDHHHHITCLVCGKVKKISDNSVDFKEDVIRKESGGFVLKKHYFELEGICKNCQS